MLKNYIISVSFGYLAAFCTYKVLGFQANAGSVIVLGLFVAIIFILERRRNA